MERLQEEVQLYKVMKYQQGYHDDTQGKTLRYPFDDDEQPQKTREAPAKKSVALADAPNVATEADIGRKRPKLGSQAGTSLEQHVSVARV